MCGAASSATAALGPSSAPQLAPSATRQASTACTLLRPTALQRRCGCWRRWHTWPATAAHGSRPLRPPRAPITCHTAYLLLQALHVQKHVQRLTLVDATQGCRGYHERLVAGARLLQFSNHLCTCRCVSNFETERGAVIGIMKAFLGLSASIYSTLYMTVCHTQLQFLLLLATVPSAVALTASIGVNLVPYRQEEPRSKEHAFHISMNATLSLAVYQLVRFEEFVQCGGFVLGVVSLRTALACAARTHTLCCGHAMVQGVQGGWA